MALLVHVVKDEIVAVIDHPSITSAELASKFPFGEVYLRCKEPQGLQWRVLQRGSRKDDKISYFDAILPISVDQLPEKVQVVHMCTV